MRNNRNRKINKYKMKTQLIFLSFIFSILTLTSFSQSKKEVKKLGIKSSVTVVTESIEGKEKTRTDMSQKFDKNGNVIELIEYNKDGSIKKKEAQTYNKNNDITEELIFDEKGNLKKKITTEYNSNKDKTFETTSDANGKLLEKTQHGYNAKGDRSYEITMDEKGRKKCTNKCRTKCTTKYRTIKYRYNVN